MPGRGLVDRAEDTHHAGEADLRPRRPQLRLGQCRGLSRRDQPPSATPGLYFIEVGLVQSHQRPFVLQHRHPGPQGASPGPGKL